MKSRRRFITDFVIALMPLGATASAQEYKAQQTGKVYRIGHLFACAPEAEVIRSELLETPAHSGDALATVVVTRGATRCVVLRLQSP